MSTREILADFSRTCEGCEYVRTEPWPVKGICSVVGIERFEPYVPAWCPKMKREKEVV